MIDNFMHKYKSKYKGGTIEAPKNYNINKISHKCLILSEKTTEDKLLEIIELL